MMVLDTRQGIHAYEQNQCPPGTKPTGDAWNAGWTLIPKDTSKPVIGVTWLGVGATPITCLVNTRYPPTVTYNISYPFQGNIISQNVAGTIIPLSFPSSPPFPFGLPSLLPQSVQLRLTVNGYFDDVVTWTGLFDCCSMAQWTGTLSANGWTGEGDANKVGPGPDDCFECWSC